MFREERETSGFSWQDLGDIETGRTNLGQNVPVWAYRLMQYTFRDVLITQFGVEAANRVVIEAGRVAGIEFCRNMLQPELEFAQFMAHLQQTLQEQKIGVLRIEKVDLESMCFTLAIAEDLDCSGLPLKDEVVCQYDEGFLAGILEGHTGKPFLVKEVDCWATGDRVCRFEVRQLGDDQR
jgi:hypothetical protein